ncbi:MAG: Major Facilitator Superfamily protein [Syntrophorhabdaceae bacterium PtaU1.Bin034]|nr:MAG: Major Facilitator Superfamily protein [Syntrophorhabdaceae bacterium PtaU1.Bin034]
MKAEALRSHSPDAGEKRERLLNPGFVSLNIVFLFGSAAMASFFHLQQYLGSIKVAPSWAGFIIGADSLAAFFLQPFLAPFLHPGNARRWMIAGLVGMAAALFSYGFSDSLSVLITIRIVQGAGFVCFVAAMTAAIVSYIPPSMSGQAFGFLSLIRLVPYALVPPAVGFVMARNVQFPGVLAGFAVLMLLSIPIVLLVGPRSHLSGSDKGAATPGFEGLLKSLRNGAVCALLMVNMLFYVAYTIVFFYIAGFGRHIGIERPELFFTIATALMIAVRLCASHLFDRRDKFSLAVRCLAGLSIAFLALIYARGSGFYALAVAFGLGWGVVMPLLNALVFDVSLPAFRGLNLNLTLIAMQAAFFLGPLAGGFILGVWSYAALFCLCFLLTLIAVILLEITAIKRSRSQ